MSGVPVSFRISEELFEDIQREADKMQVTVSELLRLRVDKPEKEAAAAAQLSDRMNRLEQQISALVEVVGKVAVAQETLTPVIADTHSMNEHLARLVELLDEEKKFPFGLNRTFVQVATLASFTLARGTFSNAPEAWEPYKEEARHRAFKKEGD
jgi:antitoxin component of RelBE/YafQ-DinJ toxin-antitoxin module